MIQILRIALVAVPVIAYFWVTEFARLMLLTRRELRGEHDKAIWAAAFVFVFFLAPFAFRVWRHAALAERAAEGRRGE